MVELSDYDLDKDGKAPQPPAPGPADSRVVWIGAAVVVVLIAGGYFWLRSGGNETAPAIPETPEATATPAPPKRSLGGDPEPIAISLDESDPIVRSLFAELSSHPRVAAWLTTDGLIRNFVVVVENISTGTSPARHLGALRPSGAFRVQQRDGEDVVDPRSYGRYTPIAAAASSIDVIGTATLYARLKPRIDEAYAELGRQESFDRALERAIVALLQLPTAPANARVAQTGAKQYRFVDPRLDNLTEAQKHLLRMGPRNVGVIQGTLREVALALGIAAERLPNGPA
jgi:hypothetical protein